MSIEEPVGVAKSIIEPLAPCRSHSDTVVDISLDHKHRIILSMNVNMYACMRVPVPYPLEQVNCRISGWHISKFLIAFRPHHTRYQRYRRGRSTMPFGLEFLVINPGGGARRSRRALIKDGLGSKSRPGAPIKLEGKLDWSRDIRNWNCRVHAGDQSKSWRVLEQSNP